MTNRRAPHLAIVVMVWTLGAAGPLMAQDYPLAAGTRWTYHLRQELGAGVHFSDEDAPLAKGNTLETLLLSSVVGTDTLEGARYARVESRRNGKLRLVEWLCVTPEGLLLAKTIDYSTGEETPMMPPQRLLSPTLLPGEAWNWKQATAPVSSRTEVMAPEQVSVPAGSFRAVPVQIGMTFTREGAPLVVRQTRWFVPGVGYVKQDTRAEVAGHLLTHTVLTLQKFEAGAAIVRK